MNKKTYLEKFHIDKRDPKNKAANDIANRVYEYFDKKYDWNMIRWGKVQRYGVYSFEKLFDEVLEKYADKETQAKVLFGVVKNTKIL